ncbi:(2Fe-2S) ferredoxin domain-containing protein [Rhodopseudomonas sp. BAL398]|uniref:(2Fe-2S) ferredoxin domain-containing protein n=1 Tax=Rhodopseudomonas TaxID=1073 RepID=UPI00294B82BC|nr:(2Fe-2S) ferredoxin domain-containing protein [Rhodopseudomonas sp. BAL398]WOK15545.1 (2Fe-2S) ferredoxin domain-containing protein [Rhodopseudomonas sp. BAL398]
MSRVADGKALRKALKAELKRRGAAQHIKPPRLVQTGCLGICPKRAAVIAGATTLSRGEFLLAADAEAAIAAAGMLMPDR